MTPEWINSDYRDYRLDTNPELLSIENTLNAPDSNLDDGWDDADTVNENIFCPNPELWVMELCDQQWDPIPTDGEIDDAYNWGMKEDFSDYLRTPPNPSEYEDMLLQDIRPSINDLEDIQPLEDEQ